jgi:hypothetical protein
VPGAPLSKDPSKQSSLDHSFEHQLGRDTPNIRFSDRVDMDATHERIKDQMKIPDININFLNANKSSSGFLVQKQDNKVEREEAREVPKPAKPASNAQALKKKTGLDKIKDEYNNPNKKPISKIMEDSDYFPASK